MLEVMLELEPLLKGSWDLATGVKNKVTILIITHNPIKVLITLLTKSHNPPSKLQKLRPGLLNPSKPSSLIWFRLQGLGFKFS